MRILMAVALLHAFYTHCNADLAAESDKECGTIMPGTGNWMGNETGIAREAKYNEFPWIVKLFGMRENQTCALTDQGCWDFICGASLISLNVVLTAGKCVYRSAQGRLKARAGDWNLDSLVEPLPYQERLVRKIIIHNLFENGPIITDLKYDAALAIVDLPYSVADNISPICLPPPDQNVDSSRCKAAGWGRNTGHLQPLHVADMDHVDHDRCQTSLRTVSNTDFVLHDSFTCSSSTKDNCLKKHGLPLVCLADDHYYARGFYSWSVGCGSPIVLDVYIDLVKMRDWVDQQMRANGFNTNMYTHASDKPCLTQEGSDGRCVSRANCGNDTLGLRSSQCAPQKICCPNAYFEETMRPTQTMTRKLESAVPPHWCVLPQYPHHGKYTSIPEGLKPGDAVLEAALVYSCDTGYSVQGVKITYCSMGFWVMELPTCEKQCAPLTSTSVDFKCYKARSSSEVSCELPQDHNSHARAKCKDSYSLQPPPKDLICNNGSWNYMPFCNPDCGTVAPEGKKLVIGGREAILGEFPWHVGLYDKTTTPVRQLCGGTIFSPNLVVSAAHCVYQDQVGPYPATTFAVAAGKLHRRWNAPRDDETYVQKADVIQIEFPERYKGAINAYTADIAVLVLEKSFVLSSLVRPVCIRFDYKESLEGQYGKVAGWGLTEEDGKSSPILKTVKLPYVNYNTCYNNSPEGFRPLITIDKICAGYTNGTALCKGDSGGGLVFPRPAGYQQLYHLYGVVSTSPRNTELSSCSAFAYTAFTDLLKHQEWFQNIWSEHNTIV